MPKSSPVHSYSLTGAYTITVTAEGNAICPSKSFSSFVLVNDKCETPVCVNDIAICHSQTACINKEWSITNNTILPSGGSQVFTYNYGDGSLPKSSPVHSYSLTGAYTITVTAEGNASCPAKTLSSIVFITDSCLNPCTGLSFLSVAASNASVCFGQSSTLTASGAVEYLWSNGSTSSSIVVSPSLATTYSVIGTNSIGCQSSVVITINVKNIPMLSVNSTSICSGQSTTLTATGAVSYLWNTGALTSSITISPTNTTIYTVTGTTNNCSSVTTGTVNVTPIPVVMVNSASICSGQTTVLTASGAASYLWNTGQTSASLSVNPLSNTTYSVTGFNGACTSGTTATVIVNPVPMMTSESEKTICAGENVNINLEASVPSSFVWMAMSNNHILGETVMPVNTATINNVLTYPSTTHTTALGIIYQVTPTSITGACSGASQTVTIVVNPVPAIANDNSVFICSEQAFQINITSNISSSYKWYADNNNNVDGETLTEQITDGITDQLVNTTNTNQTVTYHAIATSLETNCIGNMKDFTVVIKPKPIITKSNPSVICAGGSMVLFSTGASSYVWTGSSIKENNGSNIIVNPTSSTSYSVYGVTNGCLSETQTIDVEVNPNCGYKCVEYGQTNGF